MSAFPPPNVYFNGIIYDSDYFTQSSSGLTLSQANAKYLQKTTSDTASALETFSGGILSNTINPTTTGGTIQIGHGATNNNVEIASQVNRSVVLHLGDGNTSSGGIHIGNGAGSSNNVNIINGAYTSGQTAGTVNILSGSNAVGTLGGNCNLFTGSRGTLTIGATINNSITVVKQTQFTNGTYSDKMDGIVPTSTMTIGNNLGLGTVEIANSASFTGGVNIGTKGGVPSVGIVSIGGGSGTSTNLYSGTTNLGYTGSTLNIQTPLTPTYSYPVASTQIGYQNIQQSTTSVATSATAGVVVNIFNYAASAGLWAITVSSRCPNIAALNYYILTLSTANNTNNIYQQLVHHTDASTYYYNNTLTFFVQGGQTWYYNVSTSLSSSVNIINNSMVCTRIA